MQESAYWKTIIIVKIRSVSITILAVCPIREIPSTGESKIEL